MHNMPGQNSTLPGLARKKILPLSVLDGKGGFRIFIKLRIGQITVPYPEEAGLPRTAITICNCRTIMKPQHSTERQALDPPPRSSTPGAQGLVLN